MYLFSPSLYTTKAIRDVLFGSYSMVFTTAGIFSLSRLKSIIRYPSGARNPTPCGVGASERGASVPVAAFKVFTAMLVVE